MDRRFRLGGFALAFLIVACGLQAGAPRPSDTPAPPTSATATPRPTNATNDVIYPRSVAPAGASIVALNARTGETVLTLPDGTLSPDRATLYAPELITGATRSLVRVVDVATGKDLRSFTIDGAYQASGSDSGNQAISRDGRHLVLGYPPGKLDNEWVTRMAVVDTTSGTIEAKLDWRSPSIYGFVAISPDGRSLYLNQSGETTTMLRVFDVATGTLLPATAIAGASGLVQNGFRTPPVRSPDGRWIYMIDAGTTATNCTSTDGPRCVPNGTPPSFIAVDLASRRVQRVALPQDQMSSDFEKYLLWSVGVAPSGDTVYAVNPALGVINELDAHQIALRRTAKITVSRADEGVLTALGRFLFPVADAKRYITSGALLSPDGTRLYAVAGKGVAVVDVAGLSSRTVWLSDREFDALALTPDGERLYAVSNSNGRIAIVATRDGAALGQITIPAYGQAILRIDSAR